jgi:hypothetical protein
VAKAAIPKDSTMAAYVNHIKSAAAAVATEIDKEAPKVLKALADTVAAELKKTDADYKDNMDILGAALTARFIH